MHTHTHAHTHAHIPPPPLPPLPPQVLNPSASVLVVTTEIVRDMLYRVQSSMAPLYGPPLWTSSMDTLWPPQPSLAITITAMSIITITAMSIITITAMSILAASSPWSSWSRQFVLLLLLLVWSSFTFNSWSSSSVIAHAHPLETGARTLRAHERERGREGHF
jgi:hypothetical protein